MIANLVTWRQRRLQQDLQMGVGYKAAVVGKNVQLSLGFSHEVLYRSPLA